MRRYLLDTNAASDFINIRRGVRRRAVAARQAGHKVGTCIPAVAELYYGVEKSDSRETSLIDLRAGLAQLVIWPFDLPAAVRYGELRADLRRRGRLIGEFDVMIAAIALTLGGCPVVTIDTDFQAIPGLAVEDWRS